MWYVVRKGATARLLLLTARDARGGDGKTGLSHRTPGATAAYLREGDAAATGVPLVAAAPGVHVPGGFVEVDAHRLPGVYQFGAPDALFAAGAEGALLVLRFPGAIIDPVEVALVAYDPQDADRLGMSALGPEGRIAALRGAFPRVAARELAEREARGEDR
jgi:hypothetical protein